MSEIEKIKSILNAPQIEEAIKLHKQHGRIYFDFLSGTESEIIVRVTQKRNPNGNHSNKKELIQIAKDTLLPFIDGHTALRVHPIEYTPSPPDIVTPEYIIQAMSKHSISNKELVGYLGIEKAEISGMIRGHRPIGQRSKAMFYYFFKSWELGFNKGI